MARPRPAARRRRSVSCLPTRGRNGRHGDQTRWCARVRSDPVTAAPPLGGSLEGAGRWWGGSLWGRRLHGEGWKRPGKFGGKRPGEVGGMLVSLDYGLLAPTWEDYMNAETELFAVVITGGEQAASYYVLLAPTWEDYMNAGTEFNLS